MGCTKKIILGVLSTIFVLAAVVVIAVHFIRKQNNQTLLPESSSNTTINPTTTTTSNTMMNSTINITTTQIVETTASTMRSPVVTTARTTLPGSTLGTVANNLITTAQSILFGSTLGAAAKTLVTTAQSILSGSSVGTVANTPVTTTQSTLPGFTSSMPISPTSSIPISPTSGTPISPTNGMPISPTSGIPISPTSSMPISSTSGMPISPTSGIPISTSTGSSKNTLVSATLNIGAISTVVTTPVIASTTSVFIRQPVFAPMEYYSTVDFLGGSASVVGYFNDDSYLDIAVANYDDCSVSTLIGNGDGTFQDQIISPIANNTHPTAMAVGDFNKDNRLDIVVVNVDDGNIAIILGKGDGTFILPRVISTGVESYPGAAAVGYFDNDNILDIVISVGGTNRMGLMIGNGNGTFQSLKTFSAGGGSEPSGIAIGDFNHDNRLDVVVSNWGNARVSVFLGFGNGTFRAQTSFSAGLVCAWIDVADFNGDSHLDLAVLNMNSNSVSVLLGIGNGTFLTQVQYRIGNSSATYFLTTGDVNNDGRWDIVIPNSIENNVGILLGKGDGSFQAQITIPTGDETGPAGLAVTDFNNDNRSDIVVINGDSGEIGILLGMP